MSPTIGEILGRRDEAEGDEVIQRATMLWGRETVERLKATIDPDELPGRLRQYIVEGEAKRVELKRQATRPNWNDTVNAPSGRARHPALKSGPVTRNWKRSIFRRTSTRCRTDSLTNCLQ